MIEDVLNNKLQVSPAEIADFCRRWQITEFALFGSVLRKDFHPDSDIDVLVVFAPGARWSLLDHIRMEEERGALSGRRVDLVSKRAIERSENWIRRKEILGTTQPIYVS